MKLRMAASLLFCTSLLSFAMPAYSQTTSDIAKGNCKSVSAVCQKTMDYCNNKEGKLGQASTTNSLKDAIDACKAASSLLERGSPLGTKSASVAVDACNECAKTCDQFKDDAQMTSCANECRKAVSNLQKLK